MRSPYFARDDRILLSFTKRTRDFLILVCLFSPLAQSDDNLLAYRLYQQNKQTEAGELFSDPAWKGVAFFESQQWFRAMESFARAGDAESIYNLGNTYTQLGFWELALQAYLSTLQLKPDHEDAKHNLAIIKKLLASDEESPGQAALQPKIKAVDEVETETDDQGGKYSQKSSQTEEGNEDSAGGERDSTQTSEAEAKETRSANANNERQEKSERQNQDPGDGNVSGQQDEDAQASETSGAGEGILAADTGSGARGRTLDESEQATEQWLNRIEDNAGKFIQARIALERAKRESRGTGVEPSLDKW